MLIPRSHRWTPWQRWIIVTAAAVVCIGVGALIYGYERYYRGPGQEALYGTWEAIDLLDGETIYFRFDPDQTFSAGGLFEGGFNPFADGRWYAGGSYVYLRFSAEAIGPRRPIILHIVDVHPDEIHVRLIRSGQAYTLRRTTLWPANASNQAMQRTASKPAIYPVRVGHRRFGCESRFTGLAVADLIAR